MTDPIDRRLMLGAAGLLGAAALSRVASAGPLNPPAGPVTPTGKTLTEIEPRTAVNNTNTPGDAECVHRITQPGSYYLAGNITGITGKSGIIIDASNVTLDLMGFALLGVPGSLDGIGVASTGSAGPRRGLTIRNGVVDGFGRHGIWLILASPPFPPPTNTCAVLERLHVSGCGHVGIRAPSTSVLRDCLVTRNLADGIVAASAVVVGCVARENSINGTGGISAGGAVVHGCEARQNEYDGLTAGQCVVVGCASHENAGAAFFMTTDVLVKDCVSGANGFGMFVDRGCYVRRCTSRGGAHGIICSTTSLDPLPRNRLEQNNVTDCTTGIFVGGRLAFVSRNTCSGNTTNWNVAGQNFALVVQATTSGAVNGNGGGVAPSTQTSPHLNFTY